MRISSSILETGKKTSGTEADMKMSMGMSGVSCSVAQGRLVTLKELRLGLQISLEEARKAQKDERFYGRLLAAAKTAQATSNVILEVFGAFDERIKVVGKVSKLFQGMAKKDAYATTTAAIDLIPAGEEMELVRSTAKKRADLINSGVRNELNTSKIAQYSVDGALEVGELTAKEIEKGMPPGAMKVSPAKIVKAARAINKYAFDIAATTSELLESEKAMEKDSGAITTVLNQLKNMDAKIAELQDLVSDCEAPQIKLLLS